MDVVRILITGKLEKEWLNNSCSWCGRCHGYRGVGLVKEGVVEGEETVSDSEHFSGYCRHFRPSVELLSVSVCVCVCVCVCMCVCVSVWEQM